jgi:YHS domain-containing protein
MILDPQCQTYVLKKDAILQAGNYFCSRECAKLFLSR